MKCLMDKKKVVSLQNGLYHMAKMDENKIVIYQTEDGQTQIDVRLENETVWLTQAQMAELFQKDRTVITRHINNVFKEGELEKHKRLFYITSMLSYPLVIA